MDQILDGKKISNDINKEIKSIVDHLKSNNKRIPQIDIILIGNDFGSIKYVSMKEKKALELGINCEVHKFDEDISQEIILTLINRLNEDSNVDGIMIQLPLPSTLDEKYILENIKPEKDVDGLTSSNLGKVFKNDPTAIAPATAVGILTLLKKYDIQIEGKNTVVIGRSDIVGLPVAAMLQNENSTVTICHSHTKNLKDISINADILVVALGEAKYISQEYIKEGAVVIDVGTNKNEDGKIVGDVDFDSVKDKASYITPVPGGVGPMTIASLFQNLLICYELNNEK